MCSSDLAGRHVEVDYGTDIIHFGGFTAAVTPNEVQYTALVSGCALGLPSIELTLEGIPIRYTRDGFDFRVRETRADETLRGPSGGQ